MTRRHPLHDQWLADQADAAARAGDAGPGIQSARAWHAAISQPTPAMQAAAERLRATLAARRQHAAPATTTDKTQP